ncbi:MAG: hypothetical protein RLY40_771 [Pseudomonadota bacterium]|jgi:hypothetical protein
MFKHVIPKQQPYFERKKEEFEITKITEAIKAAEQEEAKEAERKKLKEEKKATIESLKLNRPCYDNVENNGIPAAYARTALFQAGKIPAEITQAEIIIEHVGNKEHQRTIDIILLNGKESYIPISSAELPENIKENITYTFTTFGK